ncbi:MAG: LytR family transcriptional regulator [Ruminococcaceae bacterium]|nr:LytR family transcriptional regulator [Oscillospiraceae bacterium]
MSDKKYSNDDSYSELLKMIEEDYELNKKINEPVVEYEDVYSNSTPTEYEDVYSFSDSSVDYPDSSKDVYIGRTPKADDVYISKPKEIKKVSKFPTEDIPVVKQPAPVYNTDDDEDSVSDFEAKRKKKHKKKPVKLVVLAVLLAVIIGLGSFASSAVNSIVGKFQEAEPIEHIENVESLVSDKNVRNILFIGADKESGGNSRSDSIMLISVNKKTGRITVCSILRDTHLDIPGEREAKVNAAYSWGGANLLIQTIEQNFGIKIDDYATVDFEMFTDLVDALGGIEVEVTENEADYINNRHRYGNEVKPDYFESGESVHLNGYQALWYSRIRKLDSDFMRTERQRKVITAIFEKVKDKMNPAGVFELMDTAEAVAPFVKTTLSASDFWSLATSVFGCFSKSGMNMEKLIVQQQIPFEDTWHYSSEWDGSSISIDVEENKQLLYTLLYEDYEIPEDESTNSE